MENINLLQTVFENYNKNILGPNTRIIAVKMYL